MGGLNERGPAASASKLSNRRRAGLRMRERLRVIAPYAIVLVLAGALYLVATHFEYTPHAGRLGPEIWPRAILVLIAGVCVFRISDRAARAARRGSGRRGAAGCARERAAGRRRPDPRRGPRLPGLLALGIAITIAYVWLLGLLGFALASALYIGAMIRVGRYRRWRVIVPTALVGSLASCSFSRRSSTCPFRSASRRSPPCPRADAADGHPLTGRAPHARSRCSISPADSRTSCSRRTPSRSSSASSSACSSPCCRA